MAVFIALSVAGASCTDNAPQNHARAASDLDRLFERLKTAVDAEEAQLIEAAILTVWSSSGKEDVDRLMHEGLKAVHEADVEIALAAFDEVVRQAPSFAEGWNMRALVHWLQDDYAPAVADLGHVLVLEPRHYGALNLLGRIFVETGNARTAVRVFEEALKINPYLEEAQQQIHQLRDQVAGVPI